MRHLSKATTLLALSWVGCAAAIPAATPSHPFQDDAASAELATALVEAYDTYEREVESAYAMPYSAPHEARAAAGAHSWHRFEAVLQIALLRRGVSLRAFEAHCVSHPRFAAFRERLDRTRGAHLRYRAASIANRIGYEAFAEN